MQSASRLEKTCQATLVINKFTHRERGAGWLVARAALTFLGGPGQSTSSSVVSTYFYSVLSYICLC